MAEWKKVRLGDIVKTNQNTYSPKEKWGYVNYLDTGNLTMNRIDSIQYIDLSKEKLPSRAKRKVKYNSIVYSTVRPNQLHYGIVKDKPENFLVSTGFVVVDVDYGVANPDYIYYILTQREITEHLQAIGEQSVSAYPSIKPSDIENLEVYLPGLEEQERIVSILSAIDEKERNNCAINNNLEQQAQLLYNNFISTTQLTDMTMAEIIDVRDGTHDSPKAVDMGYPLVTSKHLLPFGVDIESPNKISERDYNKANERSKVDTNDILLSMIGTVGLVSLIIEEDINFAIKNVGLFKTSKCPQYTYYLLCYLKSRETVQHIEKCLAGSTQKYISLTELRKMPIAIPSSDKINEFNKLVTPLFSQIINNVNENKALSAIKDNLLPKLMSGEIDVANINF